MSVRETRSERQFLFCESEQDSFQLNSGCDKDPFTIHKVSVKPRRLPKRLFLLPFSRARRRRRDRLVTASSRALPQPGRWSASPGSSAPTHGHRGKPVGQRLPIPGTAGAWCASFLTAGDHRNEGQGRPIGSYRRCYRAKGGATPCELHNTEGKAPCKLRTPVQTPQTQRMTIPSLGMSSLDVQ